MDKDKDIDDLLDLTDSSNSSSSNGGVFKAHTPFVLELHDVRKDDQMPTESVAPIGKFKKPKKKKKDVPAEDKSHSSMSSDSLSEASSVAPLATDIKEEFYDAHESYHAIPENQGPVVAAARLQGHSKTSQNLKATPQVAASPEQETTTIATRKEPSPVIKSTLPQE